MNPHQKNKIDVSVRRTSSCLPASVPPSISPCVPFKPQRKGKKKQKRLTSSPSLPLQTLSPEEQRLFRLYGKLPSQASVFARNNQRKYFDSGDYALNKAGKGDGVDTGNVGSIVPDVDTIRHNSPATAGGSINSANPGGITTPGLTKSGSVSGPSSGIPVGSPAKESSLQRETSAEEALAEDDEDKENVTGEGQGQGQGIPIRT